ncbi:methyltransferase domain-containing protein [Saccharothrix sp. ST-888]|uniref:methyltransferase domain-containing protein n=1 Tax=Saccharothrix sp. ST-888 TaxID=1427391 RepID=UPI0005EC53C2|nr:methyltransferase domain-containing protein [Saccharothrix sp. ST-888]KJK55556.1 SAM-dependent methyltransferase [Saccharothrix sp. ST-888]
MTDETAARFHQRVIGDAGAAVRGLTVALGERLGLYRALHGAGPLTIDEFAERAGIHPRYSREWLHAQVAADYVAHDPEAGTYRLTEAQAAVLGDPDSATYAAPFFTALKALYATEDQLAEAYRSGGGVGWAEHHASLDSGMGSYFLPGYRANLVQHWLPALDGVTELLARGGRVADIGCGPGHATLLIAQAFPDAVVHGYDYSEEAISQARRNARAAGLADRVVFEVAGADGIPGGQYDLITYFNVIHDLGDPETAARQVLKALTPDGVWMIVEPNAHAAVTDNVSPAGRLFMGLSAVMCLPVAAAEQGPYALGNHAGEDALGDIARAAGFTRWRRATESAVNAVYEARP